MKPLIPLKGATPLFFIALALLYFAVLPQAQAVIPPPDGGYPGFNTAEGTKSPFWPHHRRSEHRRWLVFAL